MMCKHFGTPQGCSYGDKCQFAHGAEELRTPTGGAAGLSKKPSNNFLNYKIVKCKNWERDKQCKYGEHCTFAHGDDDVHKKDQNASIFNNPGNMFMFNPFMMGMGGMGNDMSNMVMPPLDMQQMKHQSLCHIL